MYQKTRKQTAKFQQTFICEFYDKQEAVIISRFTSYIGRKKNKKKSPTFLKIHLDQMFPFHLTFVAFFCFSSASKSTYVQRKCSSVGLKRERATYFHSDRLQISCSDSAFLKETKRTGEYKPFFSHLNTRGTRFLTVYSFYFFHCILLFIQETSIIKKEKSRLYKANIQAVSR